MFGLVRRGLRTVRRRIRKESSPEHLSAAARFWITLLIAVSIIFASYLFPLERVFAPPSAPQVGDLATEDIIAPFDFPVYKTDAELEFETRQVLSGLPAVMIFDQQVLDDSRRDFERLLYLADSIRTRVRSVSGAAERLRVFYPQFSAGALQRLIAFDSLAAYGRIVRAAFDDRYLIGVAESDSVIPQNYSTIQIRRGDQSYTYARDQIRSLAAARAALIEDIAELAPEIGIHNGWAGAIAASFVVANAHFSPEATLEYRERMLDAIAPVEHWVRGGQIIVAKGEPVTRAHVEQLMALAQHRSESGIQSGLTQYLLPILSRLIFVAFVILSFVWALQLLRGRAEFRLDRIAPLMLIILTSVATAYLITEHAGLSIYIVPLAAGIMLTAILYDFPTALLLTILEALLFGIIFEFNFEISFIVVASGVVAAFTMRNVKKRSDFYRGALYLAVTLAAAAFLLESLRFSSTNEILRQCGYGVINAAISAFVAMALLPLFESLFNFTTNITLLELSDMNHPLLKRLALESPGTYHHSLVIGSLCEAAAEAIGANPLLARVGAYYHDVGKMEIPDYFVENQTGLRSRHEELSPSMSAIVIKSHITRGRELAEENDLPDKLIAFIEEHHGTSLMSFFYNKAREINPEEEISDAEFRYPGPKPQSKETAILMLADSTEAASRTLDDPKPARIRSLIRKIINDKFQQGQLSESTLTLSDLQGIEDAFAKVLIGAFHSRVDYPRREEEKAT